MSTRVGRTVELGPFTPPGGPARPVRAYVPTRVDLSRPHPTLYLLDGQNVFGDHGSYAGGWHAHEAVERLAAKTLDPPVIVAVANGGVHRISELGAGLDGFLNMFISDLIPRVEAALGGGGPRVLGGASLGGLASLHAWIHHPHVFHSALVMSPSLWFQHRALLHHVERGHWPLPRAGRLYLDAGARERGRMYADAAHLAAVLRGAGMGEDRLLWRPDRRGAHHERHWRRRLPRALRFLFRR